MWHTTPASAAAIMAAAAVLVTGCGIGSSPEGRVSETVDTYLRSLADGDAAAACAQLTLDARRRLGRPCARAMGAIRSRHGAERLAAAADGDIELDVAGRRATVTVRELAGARLILVLRGERWRIDAGPLVG